MLYPLLLAPDLDICIPRPFLCMSCMASFRHISLLVVGNCHKPERRECSSSLWEQTTCKHCKRIPDWSHIHYVVRTVAGETRVWEAGSLVPGNHPGSGASMPRYRNSCVATGFPSTGLKGEEEAGGEQMRGAASMVCRRAHGPSSEVDAGLRQDPALWEGLSVRKVSREDALSEEGAPVREAADGVEVVGAATGADVVGAVADDVGVVVVGASVVGVEGVEGAAVDAAMGGEAGEADAVCAAADVVVAVVVVAVADAAAAGSALGQEDMAPAHDDVDDRLRDEVAPGRKRERASGE